MAPSNVAAAAVLKQSNSKTAKDSASKTAHTTELPSADSSGTSSGPTSKLAFATTSRHALPRRTTRTRQQIQPKLSFPVPSLASISKSQKKTTGKRKRSATPVTDAESVATSVSEGLSSRTSVSNFADDAITVDSESDDFSVVSEQSDTEESEVEPTDASDFDEAPAKIARKVAAGRKKPAQALAAVKKPAGKPTKNTAAGKRKKARKVAVDGNGEQIRDDNADLVYESDDCGAHVHQDYVDSYKYKMLPGVNLPPISRNSDIFQDLTNKAMTNNFGAVIKHLNGHKLRVATMCSGTESPILALDLIVDSQCPRHLVTETSADA